MRTFEISSSLLDGVRNVPREEGLLLKKVAKVVATILLLFVSWFADLCWLPARSLFVQQVVQEPTSEENDPLVDPEMAQGGATPSTPHSMQDGMSPLLSPLKRSGSSSSLDSMAPLEEPLPENSLQEKPPIFEISSSLIDGIRKVGQEEGILLKKIAKVVAAILLLSVIWFADLCYLSARALFVVQKKDRKESPPLRLSISIEGNLMTLAKNT